MAFLTTLFSGRGARAAAGNTSYGPGADFWYTDVSSDTASGARVTPDTALRVSAVFACIRVRAETLASLPLFVYRRLPNGGKERAPDHALYPVLHHRPNAWQTSYEWRAMMSGHLDLRGNAYSEIIPGPRGAVDQLVPLHPDRVQVSQLENGRLSYEVKSKDPARRPRVLTQDQVFHVRGLSCDGIMGLSPIALAREAIGLAMAAEQHGGRFFTNGARPSGLLKHPGRLSQDAKRNLRESWERTHGGSQNAQRVAILEEGMDWQSVGMTAEDSQYIESREFSVLEICRIFRVPPYKIAHLMPGTVSYASVEQQAIDFVTDSIRPTAVNWEQRILADLIVEDETYFAEFLFDALLRGDAQSRTAALQTQFMHGALSDDEWREIENRNPLPDGQGKKYYVPLNIAPVDQLASLPLPVDLPGPRPAPAKKDKDDGGEDADARRAAFSPLIADAAERIAKAEVRELGKRADKAAGDRGRFVAWAAEFYDGHCDYVVKTLTPLAKSWVLTTGAEADPRGLALGYMAAALTELEEGDPVALVSEWQTTRAAWLAGRIEEEFFRCRN